MPNTRSFTGRKPENSRSKSYHGRLPASSSDAPPQIPRPESYPELLRRHVLSPAVSPENTAPRLTKLLLNVTIQGSLGPVHVVMSPENSVWDLIKAAVETYVKEGRRPLLAQTDPLGFDLHYSQFSLESLNPKEKLIGLGSRNFFLCPKPTSDVNSCKDEAKKASKSSSPIMRFMGFLL